jgi:hypothetical protein
MMQYIQAILRQLGARIITKPQHLQLFQRAQMFNFAEVGYSILAEIQLCQLGTRTKVC